MIDQTARARLQEKYKQNQMQNGFSMVAQTIKDDNVSRAELSKLIYQVNQLSNKFESQNLNEWGKTLIEHFKKNDVTASQLNSLKDLLTAMSEKMSVLEEIKKRVEEGKNVILPDETQVFGTVDIGKMPAVEVKNFPEIKIPEAPKMPAFPKEMKISELPPVFIANLSELMGRIEALQATTLKSMAALKVDVPKSMSIKEPVSMQGMQDLLDGIEELKKGFNILIKATQESKGMDVGKPMAVEIISDRVPRPVANPVTNISINALGGVNLATAVTVTASGTELPPTPLANRRGLVIYNNGAVTIYVGGSGVTSSSGIPVAAGTYGPAIESGSNMPVYAVTSSGTCDVRILEYSDIMTGRNITLPGQ